MSSLSPRLRVRVQQKQILTPGLVQMVSLLQLNRLELKEMISAEIAQNPVLEEAQDGVEELSPEELQPLLEAERLASRRISRFSKSLAVNPMAIRLRLTRPKSRMRHSAILNRPPWKG